MISTNPFAILAETVPSIGMQIFALAMVALAGGGVSAVTTSSSSSSSSGGSTSSGY